MNAVLAPQRSAEPLDMHEGICDPPRCDRWPTALRLRSTGGELVLGRCRATNKCVYCQTLAVVETVEMLTLDAMEYAPTAWCVLTSRDHLTRADTYDHLRQLRKSVRKLWPGVEWFVQVEFQRRGALHLNLLLKGIPKGSEEAVGEHLVAHWCQRVDGAERVGQWHDSIDDGVGVVRYLSKMLAHGLKAEQRPPIGWKGHRTSQTRGYLVRPASRMRLEARTSLQGKRALFRALREGHAAAEAEEVAELAVTRARSARWELVHLTVDETTGELVRISTLANRTPETLLPVRARRAAGPNAIDYAEGVQQLAGVINTRASHEPVPIHPARGSRQDPPLTLAYNAGAWSGVDPGQAFSSSVGGTYSEVQEWKLRRRSGVTPSRS